MRRDIAESSCKDEKGFYTNLPVDLDWTVPSAEHYDRTYHNQDWTHINETNADYTWCIKNDTLYIDIQCTDSAAKNMTDWKADLNYYPIVTKDDIVTYNKSEFLAHGGLYEQYASYRSTLLDLAYRPEIKYVRITGYSLGAFACAMCTQDMVYHFYKFDEKGKLISKDKDVFGIGYEGGRAFCRNKKLKKYFKNNFIMVKNFLHPVVVQPLKFMVLFPLVRVFFFPFKLKFS